MGKLVEVKGFNLSNHQWILIDLDNTLYSENEFLFFAYRQIANALAVRFNVPSDQLYDYLTSYFVKFGRKGLFDSLIETFNFNAEVMTEILAVLRATVVNPKIELFESSAKLLEKFLLEKKEIIVVTNGNSNQQRNKILSINWREFAGKIHFVCANDYAPKPDVRVYYECLKPQFSVNLAQAVMIGDSLSDMEFANNLGIPFIDIQSIIK